MMPNFQRFGPLVEQHPNAIGHPAAGRLVEKSVFGRAIDHVVGGFSLAEREPAAVPGQGIARFQTKGRGVPHNLMTGPAG